MAGSSETFPIDRCIEHSRTMVNPIVRVLCPKLVLSKDNHSDNPSLQWLIGSPFHPPYTVISTLRCLHQSDLAEEALHLRSLIIKGFHVIGALIVGNQAESSKFIAKEALRLALELRTSWSGVHNSPAFDLDLDLIGGSVDSVSGEVRFFWSKSAGHLEHVGSVVYEDAPHQLLWHRGCLLTCHLPLKLPIYVSPINQSASDQMYLCGHDAIMEKLKDQHQILFMAKTSQTNGEQVPDPIIIRGRALTQLSDPKIPDLEIPLWYFFPDEKFISSVSAENAGIIQVSVLHAGTDESSKLNAPTTEFCPASEEARMWVVEYELEVVCYATKDLTLTNAITNLVIPAVADQLDALKRMNFPSFLKQKHQLCPYHFTPPDILHPITIIYEMSYGEMETQQVELRKSLHLRLGLPIDRPLLRVANSLKFSRSNINNTRTSGKRGSTFLKDVHAGIPNSGVSGGHVSLVQGSYEYYHYLHDNFDDSGWGCAYRSLQTIISWFILQHYSAIDVPAHREIQQALVEIGDKDPSFIGSCEWIGAIELSYALDRLLGVTSKVINVRSGSELPDKCRELAMHFESQGTPIMIGGGVLAYTLLGVDYNEASGDSAFLILDPHYTGNDDLKKIVNGGWCSWKKAVDNKGNSFFMHDKFYNLLLPQRPDMV